jgi:exonuclease SbcC
VRPLRLELKGFTSFRDEQVIDFSGLELFAIAGPTGAGKSSILDAMTYSLYGCVERVGHECQQLISQGLPTMAVTLEFAIGEETYQVFRRTYRKAPTDVLLSIAKDGGWKPLASKVKEVTARIEEVIGLDYEGFTRAVLLPQNKFDQFLAGDATVRRRILTDLLGLHIFQDMAKQANKLVGAATIESRTKQSFVESDYSGVSVEALAAQKAVVIEARAGEQKLVVAQKKIRGILSRWQNAQALARDLRGCSEEASTMAASSESIAKQIGKLAKQADEARAALAQRTTAADVAAKAAAQAKTAADSAVKRLGTTKELVGARTRAEQLDDVKTDLAEQRVELVRLEADVPKHQARAAQVAGAVVEAKQAKADADGAVIEAREALDGLRHEQRVAAVAQGLRRGDPCPICGAILSKLPRTPADAELERAEAKLRTEEKAVAAVEKKLGELLVRSTEAKAAVTEAATAIRRSATEIAKRESKQEDLEAALMVVLGKALPPKPLLEIDKRIAELDTLDDAATQAAQARDGAERVRVDAERSVDRLEAAIAAEGARVPASAALALAKRAQKLAGSEPMPAMDVKLSMTQLPERLASVAQNLSTFLRAYAKEIDALARRHDATEGQLLTEASETVEGLVSPAKTLDALATRVDDALRATSAEAGRADSKAKDLAVALERKADLVAQIKQLEQQIARFRAIALDLKQDAIVDFLQAQALEALAKDGSGRLRDISGQRYEFRYREDEFYVADLWYGDQERGVKTLSGGETFLASLALALSLAGQVRALSSTARARLDSLFIDEGFGSLDRQAVDLVVDALERLGADGRMIGVITHVRDITDHLPRIEVEKAATGSHLTLVM